jgi:preprotein translocase subunit YajC
MKKEIEESIMDLKTFENLNKGDRVICNYGSGATVIKTGITDNFNGDAMVKLKVDKRKWSCPYFFRTELKCIEKPLMS